MTPDQQNQLDIIKKIATQGFLFTEQSVLQRPEHYADMFKYILEAVEKIRET